jgi:hypothetical protein
LTRSAEGLQLKHDHRHQDGSPDRVSQYGGTTFEPGSSKRQEFPADAESRELFTRLDMAVSVPNVWALELDPGRTFVYELKRPGRLFRVEFDLEKTVPTPPPPWSPP